MKKKKKTKIKFILFNIFVLQRTLNLGSPRRAPVVGRLSRK
jgi:hypothetical protein